MHSDFDKGLEQFISDYGLTKEAAEVIYKVIGAVDPSKFSVAFNEWLDKQAESPAKPADKPEAAKPEAKKPAESKPAAPKSKPVTMGNFGTSTELGDGTSQVDAYQKGQPAPKKSFNVNEKPEPKRGPLDLGVGPANTGPSMVSEVADKKPEFSLGLTGKETLPEGDAFSLNAPGTKGYAADVNPTSPVPEPSYANALGLGALGAGIGGLGGVLGGRLTKDEDEESHDLRNALIGAALGGGGMGLYGAYKGGLLPGTKAV